tara:strand:+ start:25971 stop:27398 length:1428 start_codon:yes stop_codon:yes gene_type:complete
MRRKKVNTNSIKFDGANDRIVIPISADRSKLSFVEGTPAEIAAGTAKDKPFSLAAWIFVEDVTTGLATVGTIGDGSILSILDQDTGTNKHEYLFTRTNTTHDQDADGADNLLLWLYDSGDHLGRRLMVRTTSNPLQSATWHLIVATYDGSAHQNGINFYVDGVLQTVHRNQTGNPYTHMRPNAALRAAIGGYPVERGDFEDRMADVYVFDKELTLAEAKELYNGGKVKDMTKASTYNNLLSWWKMGDDQDGPGALGIKDYVSSNHGTLTNGPFIKYSPDLGTDFITLTDNHIYTSFGRTRTPKGINKDGTRLSQVTWAEYNDIVKRNDMDRAFPNSTYYVDGNVYKTINGVDTLISYNVENQRYLHLTADLTNYSRTNILVVPWYWYSGNQIFIRFAALENPLTSPGIVSKSNINYTNDLQVLAATKQQVSSKVLQLYGADKVFFQVFSASGTSLNSGGGSESDDILIFAGVSTF